MLFRPALGELVVFNSGIDADVFLVRLHGKKDNYSVQVMNLSRLTIGPFLWVKWDRLRYLSQRQCEFFFREE